MNQTRPNNNMGMHENNMQMEEMMTRSIKAENNKIQSKTPLLLSSALVKPMMTVTAMATLTMANIAQAQVAPDATPYGESVVAGTIDSFDRPSAGVLNVDQTSDRAVINWERFDIGENASTTFIHNGTGSMTVNRVTGAHSDSTQILGSLKTVTRGSTTGGGTLFVLDRNGVIFGENAQVDVGGIVASPGDISVDRFMAGDTRLELSNFGSGSIVNHATINVADAGIAAFVSPLVENHGVINARVGKVAFAAGEKVTLDLYGDSLVEIAVEDQLAEALIENTGSINAGLVQIEANAARGVVDSVINMAGVVTAQTITEQGGKIVLGGGSAGKVTVSGELNASGTNGQAGGEIDVDGYDVDIQSGSMLLANGDGEADGGNVDIWANRRLDTAGTFSATGTNGTVETSGNTLNITEDTEVTAEEWIIDPLSILLADTAYRNNYSFVDVDAISNALTAGTNVTVETGTTPTGSGHDQGDIILGGLIENNGDGAVLTLTAFDDVIVETTQGAAGVGGSGETDVFINANDDVTLDGTFETEGGDVTVDAGDRITVRETAFVETSNGDITLESDGRTNIYGDLLAASGDVFFKDGSVAFFSTASLTADELDFQSEQVTQEEGSDVTARILTGSVEKSFALASTANSFEALGAFATGTSGSKGNFSIYDNGGSIELTSAITTNGGSATFGHNGAGFDDLIWFRWASTITTDGGDVNFNSNHSVILQGDLNAGSKGDITVTSGRAALWGGADIIGRSLDFDSDFVNQNGNTRIAVGTLSGTTKQWATFNIDTNEIDTLAGFTTGTASSNSAFTLYTKNNLRITDEVSTAGGAVNITSEAGQIDVRDGAEISTVAGNIFLGAATVNLWEDLNTSGTVSGTASRVNVRDDAAEIQDGVDLIETAGLVTVAVGTYDEDVIVDGKDIDLQGARSGADARIRTGDESVINGSVKFENVTAGSVRGFTIQDGDFGVWVENAGEFVIANNIISNVNDSGWDDDGVHLRDAQNVTIQRNVINNSGDDGIHARGNVDGLTISSNNVGRANGDAIDLHLTSGAITVDRNVISGGSAIGVHAKSTEGVRITNNDISGARNDGIKVTDGSIEALVQGNTVTGASNGIDINGGRDHDVKNNTLEGSGSTSILISSAAGTDITGNTVNNAGGDAIEINSSAEARALNNIITAAGGEGIDVNNSALSQINNNEITGTGSHGISLNPSPNSTVQGNTILNAGDNGINIDGSNYVSVKNNTITDATNVGVNILNSNYVSITNSNQITGGKTGVKAENADYLTVSGNTISGQLGTGTDGLGDAVNLDNSDYARILNNIITAAGDDGIDFENGSDNGLVQGNTITTAGDNGVTIRSNSDNISVKNNTISGTDNGVTIYGGADNAVVTGNTVENVSEAGIIIAANASNVSSNTVTNAAFDGIEISSSAGVTVNNNTITNAGIEGIDLNQSNGAKINGNTVTDAATNGISVTGSNDVTVSGNNEITGGQTGIRVEGSNGITISSNSISGQVGSGKDGAGLGDAINLNNSDDARILNNTISTVGDDGVNLENDSDNALISGNAITAASGTGIAIRDENDDVTVQNNTITSSKHGIVVADKSDNVSITGNTIYGIDKKGILVERRATRINGNTISATGDDAIQVSKSADVDILNNIISDAGNEGIDVNNSARADIKGNTIVNTVSNGISINPSAGSVISGNTVTAAGGNGIDVSSSNGTRVTNNDIYSSGLNGIAVSGSSDVRVDNNTVIESDENGIVISGGSGNQVDNNAVAIAGENGVYANGTSGLTIKNNDVGVVLGDAINVANGSDTTITGNLVGLAYGDGINVSGATGTTTIDNNKVLLVAGNGISAEGEGTFDVGGNEIALVGGNGIYINGGAFVNITNNDITYAGLGFTDWVDGLLAEGFDTLFSFDFSVRTPKILPAGVAVPWADGDGVKVENAGTVLVEKNRIAGTGGDGVEVSTSGSTTVAKNTIFGTGLDWTLYSFSDLGAHFSGLDFVDDVLIDGEAAVFGNDNLAEYVFNLLPLPSDIRWDDEGGQGIYVHSSTFLAGTNISNNTVSYTANDGVKLENVYGVNIEKNTISNTGDDGIDSNNSGNTTVLANTVSDADSRGIELSNLSSATVEKNTVSDTGSDGISVKYARQVSVTKNTVSETEYDGIEVENVYGLVRGNNVTISGNTVTDAGDDGIDVESSGRVSIADNKVSDTDNNGIEGSSISRLSIAGNTVDDTGENGIEAEDVVTVSIDDNKVSETSEHGIYVNEARKIDVTDNRISFAGYDGINVQNVDGFVFLDWNAEITGNRIENVTYDSIDVNNIGSLNASDNYIRTTGDNGIELSNVDNALLGENNIRYVGDEGIDGDNLGNIVIWNNVIRNVDADGIDLDDVDNAAILSNTVRSAGSDGIEADDVDNIVIWDNTISNVSSDGIDVDDSDYVFIVGNDVKNAGDNGIQIDDTDTLLVLDNDVDNSSTNGIYITDTDNAYLYDNVIVKSGSDGIYLEDGDYADIRRNDVSKSGSDGIDVNDVDELYVVNNDTFRSGDNGIEVDNSDFVRVARNDVTNSKGNGIEVDGSEVVRIIDNTVEDSGENGIYVDDADNARIKYNTVYDSGLNGIYAEDTYGPVTIRENTVELSGKDGILVEYAENVRIIGNEIFDSGDDGVDVYNADTALVEDNFIRRSGDDGVDIDDVDGVDVIDNNIRYSDDKGISIETAETVNVLENRVRNSGDNGIEVEYVTGDLTIDDNTVRKSGENGIYVSEVNNVRLRDNNIYNSGLNGIYLDNVDTFAALRRNWIETSDEDGILVEYAGKVRAINNDVFDSGDDGIDIYEANKARVERNFIRNLGDDGVDIDDVDVVNVEGNNIRYSDDKGITIDGAETVTVLENRVRNSGDTGIEVENVDGNVDIDENIVRASGDHGIYVEDVETLNVTGNTVLNSEEDAIHVEDVYGYGSEYAVFIEGNTITKTGDDGIEVINAGRTRIEGNIISDIGVSRDEGDFFGADAIHVREVENRERRKGPRFDIDAENAYDDQYAVEIVGNTIDTTGDDGAQVLFSGNTLVEGNNFTNIGTESGSRIFGADAVSVVTDGFFGPEGYFFGRNYTVDVIGNTASNVLGDGIEIHGANNVLVDGNILSDIGDDGVRITGYNGYFDSFLFDGEQDGPFLPVLAVQEGELDGPRRPPRPIFFLEEAPEFNAVVSNNIITTVGGDGVETTNLTRAEISGNEITGAAFNGYYASGPFNGQVIVSDNLFTDNTIGAHFESGEIDLTGLGNGFIGGDTGMRFSPYDFSQLAVEEEGLQGDFRFGAWSFAESQFPIEGFADMSLVDNTIGSQLFNGQETFFVELDNEAFFAPGSPTILNALDSTYFIPGSGFVTPADTGGVLTFDQFTFLEDRFFHFTDDSSLGLFFFGFVPGIDQEDIFRNIAGFDPEAFNVRLTILGLPRVTLPTGGAGPAGFDPAFLNQLTPAAGGEGEELDIASQLNAIESAAGAEETSCQGAALSSAEAGTAITYSFGSSLDDAALDSAFGCGL